MLVPHCLIFLCVSVFINSVTLACNHNTDSTKSIEEHGYHVSIRAGGIHICSGSIISPRFILTSYSCIFMHTQEIITVVAGTTSLETVGDSYVIEQVIVPKLLRNDIALLRTEKDIIFHDGIEQIDIANAEGYDDDYEVSVTGWEHVDEGNERHNYVLQHRSGKIYDKKACKQHFYTEGIDDCMCIYDPSGEEICHAEKGGAIVADGYQIGIYTQFEQCYNSSEGRVHTSVYPYMKWIKENINLNVDTTPNSSPTPSPTPPSHVGSEEFNHDASPGAYPYHVSIRHNDEHECSGSIINKRHILTSINCIMRFVPSSLNVMVGINSLNETGTVYEVDSVISHSYRTYDVALIHLTSDIKFDKRVRFIEIVASGKRYRDSQKLTLTGWQRKNPCGPISDKLQHIPFRTMSYGKCQQFIPFVNPMYMCSMEESSHTCNMDYGAPIVNDRYQVALNPANVGCGERFDPHLHFPLYRVAKWIKYHSYVGI